MEEIAEHSSSGSHATSLPSSVPTSGIPSFQSVSHSGAECVKDSDWFTGVSPRRLSDEGTIICSDPEHDGSFPNDVVSSVTMNTAHGAVDLVNVASCVQSGSLKRGILDSESPDEIGGSIISETFQAHEVLISSKDTLKTNGDVLDVPSVQTEDCAQSMLDDVDDYHADVILDQPLSEFGDDKSENVGLGVDDNSCLESGECISDLLENKGIGNGNDLTYHFPSYAVTTGHFPQMMPSCYPPHLPHPAHQGSVPWYPYPWYLPCMVSGAPMMPTASQLPSCLMHSQSAEHCSGEGQSISGLPEQDNFAQPSLIAPMYTAFPNGFNIPGFHMTPYGYQMSPYLAMHIPPFQHFHPAHGEINNSTLETGHVKSATGEI